MVTSMLDKTEIQNLIKELIEKTTVAVDKVSIDADKPVTLRGDKDKTIWFGVEVQEPHFFWERGGEALFAVNHLIRRIIEVREGMENQPGGLGVLVDINGFQKKRIESLHGVAHMMAERARYFKSNIEIEPMPAFERRIVHEFLSDATDLKTESEGEGHSRRVVIKYIGEI